MAPDAPADGYDEMTVEDVKSDVRDGKIDPAFALEYERDHKDRVTLTRWLDDRVVSPDEDGNEPEEVPVASHRPGMVAGLFFERAHEVKVVEKNKRVEEAIGKGDLRLLDYEP